MTPQRQDEIAVLIGLAVAVLYVLVSAALAVLGMPQGC